MALHTLALAGKQNVDYAWRERAQQSSVLLSTESLRHLLVRIGRVSGTTKHCTSNETQRQEHQPLHKRYVVRAHALLGHPRDQNRRSNGTGSSTTAKRLVIDLVLLPKSLKHSRVLQDRFLGLVYDETQQKQTKVMRIISRPLPKQERLV